MYYTCYDSIYYIRFDFPIAVAVAVTMTIAKAIAIAISITTVTMTMATRIATAITEVSHALQLEGLAG